VLASAGCKANIARARQLIAAPMAEVDPPAVHDTADPRTTTDHPPPCPCCGGRMIIVVKALHELDEGGFSLLGQQPFQLHGTNDDRGILAANGDALWPFALGPLNHLAESALASSSFHPG